MATTASSARAEVTLRSKTMVLDFEGSVERAGDSVRLSGLRLVADLPDAGGPEDGGTVLLEHDGDSLTATVVQPGGKVELTTSGDVRWTESAEGLAAGDEICFALPESPESTILSVRGLVLRVTS
ncbi:hypothetical protein ABZ345_01975 [Lentzea sp. NPDC005914]|uniref:hypothetical protein n=1 Tax=Lentzea sp. NPDC005914 TaxID=3154572 RepID=UPI0033E757E1